MSVSQTEFRRALFDPEAPVPTGMVDADKRPAGKRFNVYRNNVVVGLSDALEAAFPVIHKLVGDEFFRAMAGVYIRQNPPSTPMIMLYGSRFPKFLRKFKPVAHLGYLPDMARLELALRTSYHAADRAPIDPSVLPTLAPDALMASQLELAPAVQVVRSDWPIHAIWRFNTADNAPSPDMVAQDVLITRPDFDAIPQVLPEGGAIFVEALLQDDSFATALGKAKATCPKFDLGATLGLLLAGGAITQIKQD